MYPYVSICIHMYRIYIYICTGLYRIIWCPRMSQIYPDLSSSIDIYPYHSISSLLMFTPTSCNHAMPCHWSLLAVLPQCWIKLPQQSSTEKRHHVFHSHSKPCKIIQNHSSYHSKCSIVFNHIHVFSCIFTKFIQIHSPFSRKKVPLHQLHNGNDRVDRVSYVEFQWISMT